MSSAEVKDSTDTQHTYFQEAMRTVEPHNISQSECITRGELGNALLEVKVPYVQETLFRISGGEKVFFTSHEV